MPRNRIVALVVLLLGFGLLLRGLIDHNIWFDEGFSIWMSRQPVGQLLDLTARDVHPALYYLILKGWRAGAGEGEFIWRFPAVLAGALSLATAYALGRELGGDLAGLASLGLFGLARLPVALSQETRMYTLAIWLGELALVAALKVWRTGSWRAWVVYVLSLVGALNTLYLMAAIPLVTNLAFVYLWWRRGWPRHLLTRWAGAQLAAALLFLPWALYVLPRLQPSTFTPDQPTAVSFVLQLYATSLVAGAGTNIGLYLGPVLVISAVLLAGVVRIPFVARKPEQQAGMVMLLAGLVVPALIMLAIAFPLFPGSGHPLADRYSIPLAPCFFVLLGWGLSALWTWRRPIGLALASLVVAILIGCLAALYPGRMRSDDFLSIASLLQSQRLASDEVVLEPDGDWPTFVAHYADEHQEIYSGQDWNAAKAEAFLAPLWQRSEAIWLVVTPDAVRFDPALTVEHWLSSRAFATITWDFGANKMTVYARTRERARTLYDLRPGAVPPDGPTAQLADGGRLRGVWWPVTRYLVGDTLNLALYWDIVPRTAFTLELRGPKQRDVTVAPGPEASRGVTRQVVPVFLAGDLSPGQYRVYLRDNTAAGTALGMIALESSRGPAVASDSDITHLVHVRLGDAIELVGYDLDRASARPGDVVNLTLYWRASAVVPARYKVITALLGEQFNPKIHNPLWAQDDSEPANWTQPTSRWVPGELVVDRHALTIDAVAPPGSYQLLAGMYGLTDGVRLQAYSASGENLGDIVTLQPFDIDQASSPSK